MNTGLSRRLTREEIGAKLETNIEMMKSGGKERIETDQYRVFKIIIEQLKHREKPLRLRLAGCRPDPLARWQVHGPPGARGLRHVGRFRGA